PGARESSPIPSAQTSRATPRWPRLPSSPLVRSPPLPLGQLTLRLSCGARAPQRFRPRPPARRLLQPVVSRLRDYETPVNSSDTTTHLLDLSRGCPSER